MNRTVPHHISLTILLSLSVLAHTAKAEAPLPPPMPTEVELTSAVAMEIPPRAGFDRLAREMKVSRGTVLRACDFANRDEAAAAAREGRKPTRPPYKWSDESRAAKRKARGA
jgi:hypothetical protein